VLPRDFVDDLESAAAAVGLNLDRNDEELGRFGQDLLRLGYGKSWNTKKNSYNGLMVLGFKRSRK